MKLDYDKLRKLFYPLDFSRGEAYFRQNKVHNLEYSTDGTQIWINARVRGSMVYHPEITIHHNTLEFSCDCPRFDTVGQCKHLAAVMLAYLKKSREDSDPTSDRAVQQLLEGYLTKSESHGEAGTYQLIPQLRGLGSYYNPYPVMSFRVGREKPYAVKNIKEFLEAVQKRSKVTYGKGLSFVHNPEQFDERSRRLIRLLMNEYDAFRIRGGRSYDYSYGRTVGANQIQLSGEAFDRFFDLFASEGMENASGKWTYFTQQDPEVKLSLEKKENCAYLTVEDNALGHFFGSAHSLYMAAEDTLVRCSEAFRENVYPLLELKKDKLRIAYADLPTFCSCVLPAVEELVKVEDPEGLLQAYLPEDCTPCFYFDMEDEILLLKPVFRYSDREIPWDTPTAETADLRRDIPKEQQMIRMAEKYFTRLDNVFYLDEEEAIYELLLETMDMWRSMGEVYLSERLHRKQLRPEAVSVGISVSDGLLQLELDTGGFPVEELSELYQSLLRRKKYHRLPDGRYLALNGSSIEKMAEISRMLQLSPRDLEQGTVTLPAFRGLYLDSILSGRDGLQITRDQQFRQMIRKFKAVDESDDVLLPGLEKTLRPYQKTGFRWLKTLESCGFGGILADEMGLGKTLQIISYLTTVPRESTGMPNLVVCPTSLILNWGDELRRFAPHLTVALVLGNAAQRSDIRRVSGEKDVWVTSYELLRQDVKEYRDRDFYSCILDEGQHIKNQTTLVSKAVKSISCRQRFVLTGTPIENRLSELWNLFDFLMPGYLFTNSAFKEKLEKPIIKSQNQEAATQLRKLVQPFILRRLKKDVLKELPPKVEHVRRIPLSEEERKIYYASVLALRSGLDEGKGKLQILAALTQLRQICCDPGLCFENYRDTSAKMEACMELCESMVQNGHQILLFSQFTSMLDRLREKLTEKNISSFTLQGSTPKEHRARMVKAFNRGEASVFLISLKAGGTGLNLTAADVVIHYDPWWNLAAQNQATDRAHRIGQQSHVQVYKLIARDTIEEKILDLQEKKAALMETISADGSGSILNMSKEELMELLAEP